MIVNQKSYTKSNSGLIVEVHKVHHISDKGYVKFKATLFSKQGNHFIETKNYKVLTREIEQWEEA